MAQGTVLEIGVGPGFNFVHYDPARVSKVYALEPNPGMIRLAERHRRRTALKVEFLDLPGEHIPLADDTVDTVVSTFTLCTIPGVVEAIGGIERVLRPGGQFIFFEQGYTNGGAMTIFSDNPFHPASDAPLYRQLYAHLQMAILSGQLKGGMKLPSTRALADELGLSRNTVLNAYEQLMAEGYLESVAGSGTFVARVLPDLLLTTPGREVLTATWPRSAESRQPILSERARLQLTSSQIAPLLPPLNDGRQRPFIFGMPALDAFP